MVRHLHAGVPPAEAAGGGLDLRFEAAAFVTVQPLDLSPEGHMELAWHEYTAAAVCMHCVHALCACIDACITRVQRLMDAWVLATGVSLAHSSLLPEGATWRAALVDTRQQPHLLQHAGAGAQPAAAVLQAASGSSVIQTWC